MKKSLATIFVTLSLFALFPSSVLAKVQYGEGEIIVGKNEVVADDLYVAGKTVRIEGRVEGDLYAAGENVYIQGEVTGDAVLAGAKLSVTGLIGQDAYLIGQNLSLSGAKIGDSLHLAGQNLNISADTLLGGSLLAAGETVNNTAVTPRSFMAAGRSIFLNAPVMGEARLAGESLQLGPKTVINQDLTYFLSAEHGQIDNQAVIKGKTNIVTEPKEWREHRTISRQNQQNLSVASRIWSYLGMLIVGAVLVAMGANKLRNSATVLRTHILRSLAIGVLITLVTPLVLILIGLTIIGLPLTGLSLLLYILILYVGKIVASFALARTVTAMFSISKITALFELFIGVSLLHLLKLIPVGGHVLSWFATWLGVGAIYLTFRKNK